MVETSTGCRASAGCLLSACSRAVPGRRASLVMRRRRDERSGRAPFVPMMQATDLRDRHDGAIAGRCDQAGNRRVFVQRQVCA